MTCKVFPCFHLTKGWPSHQIWMFFWKKSKRPLNSPLLLEISLRFFAKFHWLVKICNEIFWIWDDPPPCPPFLEFFPKFTTEIVKCGVKNKISNMRNVCNSCSSCNSGNNSHMTEKGTNVLPKTYLLFWQSHLFSLHFLLVSRLRTEKYQTCIWILDKLAQ